MALNYEASNRLFQQGKFAQLLATAPTYEIRRGLEPRHRVVLANALALVGDLDTAQRLTELDNIDAAPSNIRSHAELTLGLIEWRRGQIRSALRHFQTSVRFAHESKEAWRIGWSHLYLFRLLIESYPIDAVLATLPELRRVVGDVPSAVEIRRRLG